MDSMILNVSVDAVNVLVLIPLVVSRLDNCPDPSIWDQSVYKVDGSTHRLDWTNLSLKVLNCQWGNKGKWGGCANGSPSPQPSPIEGEGD